MKKKSTSVMLTSILVMIGMGIAGCLDNTANVETNPITDSDITTSNSRFSPGFAIGIDLIAEGLVSPVGLNEAPDESGRLFIVDQIGVIRIILPEGTLLEEPFLDLSDRMVSLSPNFDERGLLGMAFHPDFQNNGRLFVYYSAPLRPDGPDGWNHTSHIAEFTVSTDPNAANPGSERILLQVDQPQFNHNAGDIHFGPDGFLYIALGDGGGANDTGLGHTPELGNGQDATNLLGSILRIDVDTGDPYGIPADNPFIGTEGRDEIYAYGLRNPYRFSFDMMSDSPLLIAADVGQNLWEEVNQIDIGGNYGWNIREGTHCFDPENPNVSPSECPDTGPLFGDPLIDPVIEYGNINQLPDGLGISVIGGYMYRGGGLPQFNGRYIFGDWSTSFNVPDGRLFVATPRKKGLWRIQEPKIVNNPDGRLGHYILGFGQDSSGEVYVLVTENTAPVGATGKIYKLSRPGE